MSLRRFLSLVVATAMAVGLFCAVPAVAEDDLGVVSTITESGPYRYKLYEYPSSTTSFFFYPETYVTFDVVNGKYWWLETNRAKYEMVEAPGMLQVFPMWQDYSPLRPSKLRVYFYTPDMKLLGYYDEVYTQRLYSIPRDGNDYERIVAKIECHSDQNWDAKVKVWDPVDPVIAEPIPSQTYRD